MVARASVDVVGDSASAQRALEQTAVAATTTAGAFDKLAVSAESSARAMVAASTQRVARFQQEASAAKALSATYVTGSQEQAVAAELAAKRTVQANRLLGASVASHTSALTAAGQVGRGLTTYVTAPAAFIGYEAVKQAMAYSNAILLIRTQAGASQAELSSMNSDVLNLVQSGKSFGQTAKNMADGLYFVESEGIRGGRALAILQAAAAGAAKGQTDMVATTDALTSAMKIWNVSADGAVKTMATIDAITATGKMHLEDLNAAFQTKFFTTAKQLGIPLEQAGAALDVFTKAGVPAETAANNMTTSFIKMLTPAKAATPFLQQLGLTADSLGKDLQSGGLTKALAALAAGYERIIQAGGGSDAAKFAANKAILESFGGSRSGAPALALVQQYGSYLQSVGEIQRLNNPATFWSQVSQTMHEPAQKIKQDVAEMGADAIKLGQVLAPLAASIVGDVTKVAGAFQSLPGPVKTEVGVVVGLLAVAGPLGLAIKGVGTMVGGIGTIFRMLPATAGPGIAATEAEVSTLGASVVTAEGEVNALRLSLLSIAALPVIAVTVLVLERHQIVKEAKTPGQALRGGALNPGNWVWDAIKAATGTSLSAPTPPLPDVSSRTPPGVPSLAQIAAGFNKKSATKTATRPDLPTQPLASFTLPQKIATELAKAQAGYGNLAKAEADVAKYTLGALHGAGGVVLSSKAQQEAWDELATVSHKAAAAGKSAAAAARRAVTNDQLLAQARLDIAQGDTVTARRLLEQDKGRLDQELQQAKNADLRLTITKQLTEVEKLLHSKSSSFTLPLTLQLAEARANAQAVLIDNGGITRIQLRLAEQAKSAAMKAINSHTLTMQGLIDAWNVVGQANQTIAQSISLANSYHAVSTRALLAGVHFATLADKVLAEEKLAQAQAHRGYAPNGAAALGQIIVEVSNHNYGDTNTTITKQESHVRIRHQRVGGRRR